MRDRHEKKKGKYASLRQMAEKMSSGFQASYLNLPPGVKLYKPKAGTALLDILPYQVGKGNPHAEEGQLHWERSYYVHRSIGPNQETLICPAKTSGKPCPICEHRAKIRSDDMDDEDEKLVKALNAKQRQLINLQDRKDPDSGVQLFEVSNYCFGDKVVEDAMAGEEEDNWDLFFTLEDGKTLRVNFVEDSFGSNKFIKAARVDFKDRKEPIDEEVLEEVHPLDELLKELPYAKIKALFFSADAKKGKGKDDDDDDDEEEEEKPARGRRRKPAAKEPDEDDDDDDDGDDDEEPPKKRKKRPSDDDDDDDEDDGGDEDADDDGDDDDDEEEAPKSRRKKKPADDDEEDEEPSDDDDEEKPKSKKKKLAEGDDDDDDDDWDDFAGDGEEDDDDEEPKSKKKKPAADDDDDEEESKPKRRRKKKPADDDED